LGVFQMCFYTGQTGCRISKDFTRYFNYTIDSG
jgi:hypothetical protein